MRRMSLSAVTPALLMRMSILPKSLTTASATALVAGEIGDVALIIAHGNAHRGERIQCFLRGCLFAVIDDGNIDVFGREGTRDLRADPPARARDERNSVFHTKTSSRYLQEV